MGVELLMAVEVVAARLSGEAGHEKLKSRLERGQRVAEVRSPRTLAAGTQEREQQGYAPAYTALPPSSSSCPALVCSSFVSLLLARLTS